MRILVADDASDSRMLLARILGNWGYDVITADDGSQAWDILNREPIRLVISDWMMPEMDGMQLCRQIREHDFPHYIYVILLTARDDESDMIAGMDAGADDFLTKPFNRDDLQVRVRAAQRVLDLEGSLADRNRRLSEVNTQLQSACNRIRTDQEAAQRMHKSLLPRTEGSVASVRFDWLFLPATALGGDIFNFFVLDRQHVGFYHLDVAGHGIPAAMLSVTLSRFLSNELWSGHRLRRRESDAAEYRVSNAPHNVAPEIDRRFRGSGDGMPYFAAVHGVLNKNTGQTRVRRAGHSSPIRVSKDGVLDGIDTADVAGGKAQEVEFDTVEFTLGTDDRLFLYSDGITECERADGEYFGRERLQRFLSETAQIPLRGQLQQLEDTLTDWRGNDEWDDDISLLAVQFEGPN